MTTARHRSPLCPRAAGVPIAQLIVGLTALLSSLHGPGQVQRARGTSRSRERDRSRHRRRSTRSRRRRQRTERVVAMQPHLYVVQHTVQQSRQSVASLVVRIGISIAAGATAVRDIRPRHAFPAGRRARFATHLEPRLSMRESRLAHPSKGDRTGRSATSGGQR